MRSGVGAAARRDRASGLGRYLSVESASCGLGCRALNAIKTCRLELTEKRIWVSSVHVTIFFFFKRVLFQNILHLPSFLITHHKLSCLSRAATWFESDVCIKNDRLNSKCTIVTSNEDFRCLFLSALGRLRNVAEAYAVAC